MSTFGKILALLNVFGAIGLALFAFMDYPKRRAWSHSVFQHRLMVEGLPLTNETPDSEGDPVVDKLDNKTLQQMFAGTPGGMVKTQEAEVQRVHSQVKAGLGSGPIPEQVAGYARVLLPLSLNNIERERRLALIRLKDQFAQPVRAFTPLRPAYLQAFEKAFLAANAQGKGLEPQKVFDLFAKTFGQQLIVFAEAWPSDPAVAGLHLEDLHYDKGDSALARAFLDNVQADTRFQALLQGPNPADAAVVQGRGNVFDAAFKKAVEELPTRQVTALDQRLEKTFEEALTGQRTTSDGPQKAAPRERRQAIARLLFTLVVSQPAPAPEAGAPPAPTPGQPAPGPMDGGEFKRYLTVVGLEMAGPVIQEQAAVLEDITKELQTSRSRERRAFEITHQTMVEQLRERARDLAVLKENLARQRTELSQQKDLVRMRQRDVMQYEEDLAKAREETARELSKLRKMTETLLSQRIKIRDAMQRNQQFEKRLRELEGVQ
jgi:hypothetical protein